MGHLQMVERPKDAVLAALKRNGYVYICDHGYWGDKFWIHKSLANFRQAVTRFGEDNPKVSRKNKGGFQDLMAKIGQGQLRPSRQCQPQDPPVSEEAS
jgi:hypothetical protein